MLDIKLNYLKVKFKNEWVKHLHEENIIGRVKDVVRTGDGIFLQCEGKISYEPYDVVKIISRCDHLGHTVHGQQRHGGQGDRHLVRVIQCHHCNHLVGQRIYANRIESISLQLANSLITRTKTT